MSSFTGSNGPFDDDGYTGYDPRLASRRVHSVSNFDADSMKDSAGDSSPVFRNQSYGHVEDLLSSHTVSRSISPPSTYSAAGGFSVFSREHSGKGFDGSFGASDSPIVSPPDEMEREDGFALREWRRLNAIRLEEKEKKEKEMLRQIIEEAEEYKIDFYRRRKVTIENNRASNREKEKLFLGNRAKFHAEAEKNYWKASAELIPSEVPAIEKRGKKDREKKPSIVVIQGPKPGKPTDLSRMRQVLLKLKHNSPSHMNPGPAPAPSLEPKIDASTGSAASTSSAANIGKMPKLTSAVA